MDFKGGDGETYEDDPVKIIEEFFTKMGKLILKVYMASPKPTIIKKIR